MTVLKNAIETNYNISPQDTLYAIDMELVHIHQKMKTLVRSKKGTLATQKLVAGQWEWRFHPQDSNNGPRRDIRPDDYILFKMAAACVALEGSWSLMDVVVFYMVSFSMHRFEQEGTVPWPAHIQPQGRLGRPENPKGLKGARASVHRECYWSSYIGLCFTYCS